jgi:hypothetical protein
MTVIHLFDAPGFQNLDTFYLKVSGTDNFETYFMFIPSGVSGTSIWVPLKKVTWFWTGAATRNTTTNQWSLDNNSADWSHNPTVVTTTGYPTWETSIDQFTPQ